VAVALFYVVAVFVYPTRYLCQALYLEEAVSLSGFEVSHFDCSTGTFLDGPIRLFAHSLLQTVALGW